MRKPTKAELLGAAGKSVPDVIAPGLKVLFCGIKYVDISLCDTRLIAGNRSSTQPRAARATCLLLEGTTMQTRQTISGAAFISPVHGASISSCPLVYTKQGFTSRLLPASEDSSLPEMYNLGLVR